MKKINLILCAAFILLASQLKCSAKEEYYFYKASNTKAPAVAANVEKTITNKNYKVIAKDNSGNFYFIPVQMTFWDAINYGKARIRYENYFIISTVQDKSDCYIGLSKNYIAPRRKLIVLAGINDKQIKLKRLDKDAPEIKTLENNIRKFKTTTQASEKQTAENISGGNL